MFKHRRKTVGLVVLLIAAVAAVGGYAFTASNTVPGTKAGSGSGGITGYTVSNVQYTNQDGALTAVQFTLDAAARSVSVKLASTGSWHDCGGSAPPGNLVVCSGFNESASGADQLTVVANQ
jgi:hypothetical protein